MLEETGVNNAVQWNIKVSLHRLSFDWIFMADLMQVFTLFFFLMTVKGYGKENLQLELHHPYKQPVEPQYHSWLFSLKQSMTQINSTGELKGKLIYSHCPFILRCLQQLRIISRCIELSFQERQRDRQTVLCLFVPLFSSSLTFFWSGFKENWCFIQSYKNHQEFKFLTGCFDCVINDQNQARQRHSDTKKKQFKQSVLDNLQDIFWSASAVFVVEIG